MWHRPVPWAAPAAVGGIAMGISPTPAARARCEQFWGGGLRPAPHLVVPSMAWSWCRPEESNLFH